MTDDDTPAPDPVDHHETPLEHQAHHLAGAIYGTILATTVVATAGHDPETVNRSVALVAGTSVVFWAAHSYSLTVAARLVARRPLTSREVLGIAISEWPMLQSSWPILLALTLGALGVIDRETSIDVAMAVGIGALFTYGYIMGRQEGQPQARRFLNAAITGGFGLAILALKVVVH